MNRAHMIIEGQDEGHLIFIFEGDLDVDEVGDFWRRAMESLKTKRVARLTIDLEKVAAIDTAGVALLLNISRYCSQRAITVSEKDLPAPLVQFRHYIEEHLQLEEVPTGEHRLGFVERVGSRLHSHLLETRNFVSFVGEFLASVAKQLPRAHRLNIRDLLVQTQLVGVGAVPLLVSLSVLLGALMVFQGERSVRQFGAIIYIADMVVVSVTREMGPLLTAVILSGRSGAAFAAELGTMKINEEIDAITVMDLHVTQFLVLPRVFALMITAPILTILSDASGIAGGLVTSYVTLGIPFDAFLGEAQKILRPEDIYSGLIKGVWFGAVIGLVGCFRGLRTGMGADSVGFQTTSAVVSCIFLVIFFDTLFSYIFQVYGW